MAVAAGGFAGGGGLDRRVFGALFELFDSGVEFGEIGDEGELFQVFLQGTGRGAPVGFSAADDF